jgi:phage terminase large subunit
VTATAERVEHRYRPVGSAHELFACRGPEVLLSGPAGTGKSRACLEKLHTMALMNPGMRAVILRKTAVSLGSTALVTYREHVAREALASGEVRFYGGSAQEAASYRYGNGSVIVIGGMDKATRIMSSEYDVAYVQEATELTEDDWEAITTRLRNGVVSFQQIMADCNPDAPHHWLKQRCDRGATRLIYCRHEDNPRLHDTATGVWTPEGTEYIRRLDALTGVRYERLRGGKWAAAEGLIYDTFVPSVHLHKPIGEPPREWTRYWAVDFGFTNPFVWQAWAMDGDGRLFMYREIYRTQTLVEDHARAIKAALRDREPRPREIVCDHDAEGRATLERALGLSTTAAHKSVLEGIEAVKARLKPAGDGKPRLFICRDALVERDRALADAKRPVCTQDEVLEYIWDDKAKKEQPRKENDHGMDAMRYLVAAVDLVGRPRYRSFPLVGNPHSRP